MREVWDYVSDERFDLARCAGCGLLVTMPMPADDVIERYYSTKYRGDRHAFTDRMRVKLRARMLQRHVPPGFRGRLLDIGCGDGHFALHMRDAGWQISATEINPVTIEHLRAIGIEAKTPAEALADGFGHTFDAVTCWHVLEHVIDPRQLARWARSVLAPNGVFQVTVPDVSSWQAKLFGRQWLHLDVPRHRYHFTSETLDRLLRESGFELTLRSTFAFEYDWFGAVQSPLNLICSRPNVLFERLTSQARTWPGSAGDVALSCLLAPPIAALTLPLCLLSWIAGRGATLTVTCRPRGAHEDHDAAIR
jgi:2-polyprenyl-3-methyl-5-hydroxy-6-metoxy-1,4-benzoquinol methylase